MKRINFFRRTTNPVEQFVRYLIVGGIGAVMEIVLFVLLAWKLFPALREDEWLVRFFDLTIAPITPSVRAVNFAICLSITFVVTNLAGYFLSATWVFVPGRFSPKKELFLFYIFALFSYLAGTLVGTGLIALACATGTTAYLTTAAVSILINFASRKFFIFKG
jgi:putative flippase GtrA